MCTYTAAPRGSSPPLTPSSRRSASASAGAPPTTSGLPACAKTLISLTSARSVPSRTGRPTSAATRVARDAPATVDREQHAHRREVGDHRRAADAHERQRDAGDRRNPHRHAHVDEDLEEQPDDDPAGDDRRIEITRDRDDAQRSPEHEEIEREEQRRADEAALLCEAGEDEVGLALGQEAEVHLRRVTDAAPLHLPGADGGDRLLEV